MSRENTLPIGYTEWDMQGSHRDRIGDDCLRAYKSSGEEQYRKAAARIAELEEKVKGFEEVSAKQARSLGRMVILRDKMLNPLTRTQAMAEAAGKGRMKLYAEGILDGIKEAGQRIDEALKND